MDLHIRVVKLVCKRTTELSVNFVGKHREASLVEYKQLGDAGELSARAMPRLTWRPG
jgi:hypothetical protein